MEFNLRGITHEFRYVRIHWIYASMEFAWSTNKNVSQTAQVIKDQLSNINKIDYFDKFHDSIKNTNLADWPVFLKDDELDFVDKLEMVFKGKYKR